MASVATARRIRLPRAAVAQRVATPLALAALAGVVGLGLLIALQAAGGRTGLIPASWHGLPGWMRGPLPGVGLGLHGEEFAELFVWMCACYLVVVALATRVSAALAVGAVVTLHLAFLLAPPLLSADVFGYIDWARIGATHGLDPYSHGSLDAIGDPVFRYMRWHTHMGSPYGPLFTIGSYALAPLGVAASFWAFKSLAALASLAIVAFTWGCAKRLGRPPVPALLLVGLNPLVLSWAVAGAHNDLLAVAVMMGAVYLALGARERASGAVAICAAAMKASTGVVLPFMFAGARPATRSRVVQGALAGLAAVAVVAVAAFGSDAAGFLKTNESQQHLVATASLPNQVGKWLGLGGITGGIRAVAIVVLVAVIAWMLVRAWRGADWVEAAGWATLALLATSAWLMPWYIVWLLPLAAVAARGRLTLATLAFCAYLVAMRTPF